MHTDGKITLPSGSQTETRATTSAHLFVKCPSICGQKMDLETVNLARESHGRAIWNCSSCRKIKKKQVKIPWHHFVCIQCTHRNGETCSIRSCTDSCPARKTLEKKKTLLSKIKKQQPRRELIERLKILKTAWILGNGKVPQPWFSQIGSHKELISRLDSGLAAFGAEPSVTLPVGLQKALAGDVHFGSCPTRLGLDWAKAKAKAKSAMQQRNNRKCPTSIGICFKYNGAFYQDINKFCDHYEGTKSRLSDARAAVVKTNFPKWAYLVIPGFRKENIRWMPADWKDGTQDLSDLKGTAYILGTGKKASGEHILLVDREELKRAAAEYWKPMNAEIAKNHSRGKRRAMELDQQVSSACAVDLL